MTKQEKAPQTSLDAQIWRNSEGRVHRENGPAYIDVNGTKKWFLNGFLHRENGPAVERNNGTTEWYWNSQRHRENGPAFVFMRSHQEIEENQWWVNGKRHREDGPAIERFDGHQEWWINGQLHRKDGPAIEYPDGRVRYYLYGQKGPEIEQQVKENVIRIQAEKEQQELLEKLFTDDEVFAKINISSSKIYKKL